MLTATQVPRRKRRCVMDYQDSAMIKTTATHCNTRQHATTLQHAATHSAATHSAATHISVTKTENWLPKYLQICSVVFEIPRQKRKLPSWLCLHCILKSTLKT